MRDHEGDIRGFYHLAEAWYADANRSSTYTDEVNFGLFSPEGGTSGEMSVKWQELGGESVPQLQAFDDGWSALSMFPDLIAWMADKDSEKVTPKQFCEILLHLGFHDMTPRENPYSRGDTRKPRREVMLENCLGALVDSVIDGDTPRDMQAHARNALKVLGRK